MTLAVIPKFNLAGIDLSIREAVYSPAMHEAIRDDKNRMLAMACAMSGCPLPDDVNRAIIYTQLDLYFSTITQADFRLAFEFNLLQEKPIQHFQQCSWAWVVGVLKAYRAHQNKLVINNPEPKKELTESELKALNDKAEDDFLNQIESDYQEWLLNSNFEAALPSVKFDILRKHGKNLLSADEMKEIYQDAERLLAQKASGEFEQTENVYKRKSLRNLIERFVTGTKIGRAHV